MMYGFVLGLALACLLIALTALVAAGWSVTEVRSFMKSTHNVQFVPVTPPTDIDDTALNAAYDKAQAKAMEDLGSHDTSKSDSAI